jgi:hypothetical protein
MLRMTSCMHVIISHHMTYNFIVISPNKSCYITARHREEYYITHIISNLILPTHPPNTHILPTHPPHTDIDTLDEAGLRTRVAQIAAEFVGRTKWENLRLSQSLKQVEAEVSSKYLMLMLKQRSGEIFRSIIVLFYIFILLFLLFFLYFYCCGFFSGSFSLSLAFAFFNSCHGGTGLRVHS